MAVLGAVLFLVLPVRAEAPAGYRVIVNPANQLQEVEKAVLARAFLKKITRWPDGTPIRPVDRDADAPTRRALTEEVLNRTVAAVRNFWAQAIFDGRDVPPPELDSDAAVVEFVLKWPGGVGYVSPDAPIGSEEEPRTPADLRRPSSTSRLQRGAPSCE